MNSESEGAMAGIRVLDLSRLLPGPFCTLFLADMGAEVIKVEEPGRGDYARWNPPTRDGVGTGFLMLNRNKKSITLNLKKEEGRRIFLELSRTSHVILETFRPGVVDRLGIGYDVISEINPRIVYCSISGYGQGGPYKDKPGHDINYMGYAGALSLTGDEGETPSIQSIPFADIGSALVAAFSISTALLYCQRSGKGQYIDISMMDSVISFLAYYFGEYLIAGNVHPKGRGRLTGGWPGYGVYQTSEGKFITLGALEDKFWQGLCGLMGKEDLKGYRKATGNKREEIVKTLQETFINKTREEWMHLLDDADVPAGPVNTIDEVVKDPQARSRGIFTSVSHPKLGEIGQAISPSNLKSTPPRIKNPPPLLGEHSTEILRGIGYSDEDVGRFKDEGII